MKNLFQRGPIDIEIRLRTWASNTVDCLYKTMFLEAADLIQDLRKKYQDLVAKGICKCSDGDKEKYQYLSGRGRKDNDETELQGEGKEQ
jgi:hypothetical protein